MRRKRVPIKSATSFRITEDAKKLLEGLVDKLGSSKSNVVEQAIRRMARSEKIRLPGKDSEEGRE